MAFHVGQKVVCVDPNPEPNKRWIGNSSLTLKTIYTIRQIGIDVYGLAGVKLEEVALTGSFHNDQFYRASRFRPLKTTDISCFTQMLAPAPKKRVRA